MDAALEAGGRTLAVLGTGPDTVYPPENRELAARILRSGAWISEFPPGTGPDRQNFPRRNRVISGLSLGTLVVQAARDSGSLITARLAADQGREVFAVPGEVSTPASGGVNRLLREGACLVESAADVLRELAPLLKGLNAASDEETSRPEAARRPPLGPAEERILRELEDGPLDVEEIVRATGLDAAEALRLLLRLELEGLVEKEAGMRFRPL